MLKRPRRALGEHWGAASMCAGGAVALDLWGPGLCSLCKDVWSQRFKSWSLLSVSFVAVIYLICNTLTK